MHYIQPKVDLEEDKWHLAVEQAIPKVQVDLDTKVGQAVPAEQVGLDTERHQVSLVEKLGLMVGTD